RARSDEARFSAASKAPPLQPSSKADAPAPAQSENLKIDSGNPASELTSGERLAASPARTEEDLQTRRAQRLDSARARWVNDFVRTRYGNAAFLRWSQDAAVGGISFEEHLANLDIALPPLPGDH